MFIFLKSQSNNRAKIILCYIMIEVKSTNLSLMRINHNNNEKVNVKQQDEKVFLGIWNSLTCEGLILLKGIIYLWI